MVIGRSRSVMSQRFARPTRAVGGKRRGDALDDRPDNLEQRPDCGDADRPGTDDPGLFLEGRGDKRTKIAARRRQHFGRSGIIRDDSGPADQHADDHRNADRDADQVTNADQRHRQAAGDLRAASADTKRLRRTFCDQLHLAEHEIARRDQAGVEDCGQALAVFFRTADASAHLEHFGGSDTFRVGQVAAGDQRPAQRHRIHHAQDATQADHRNR